MKKIAALLGAIGLSLGVGSASADIATDYSTLEHTWAAKISPDGAYIALGCTPNKARAVCIYPIGGGEKPRLFAVADDQRMNSFFWASDEHVVANVEYFERLTTSKGIQEFDVSRLLSYSMKTKKTVMLMKEAGNYSNLTDVNARCDADPENIYTELRVRLEDGARTGRRIAGSKQGVDTVLYRVSLETGKMKVAETGGHSIWTRLLGKNCEPVFSEIYNDVRQEYAIRSEPDGDILFEQNGAPVKPGFIAGVTDGGAGVLVYTNDGLRRLDVASKQMNPVMLEGHSVGNPGLVQDVFSSEVVGYVFNDELEHVVYTKKAFADVQTMLEEALGGKTVRITSWTRDYSMLTVVAEAPGLPQEFFLFETKSGSASPLGSLAPQLAGKTQGDVISVTYSARDGREIEAFLTLPHGKARNDGPFKVIMMPHGGPEARDDASFDWWTQAYAASGYAVFQPNFRGSSGYGREHLEAGFGEFGGKMIDDIVDGIGWLKSSGAMAGDKVCVAGARATVAMPR